MSSIPLPFDREMSLAELLRAVPRARLEAGLTRTVGAAWRLTDSAGATLRDSGASMSAPELSLAISVDIETVGFLVVPQSQRGQGQAAVGWLEMVLASALRYLMAADLHLETVHADYEALQGKHAALQESEARYRELALQLEQRVKLQVELIERAQRQLFQSEKMASIGSLAAGMAHEINNPVGFIRSNLSTASIYFGRMSAILQSFKQGHYIQAEADWSKHDMDFVIEDMPGLLAESVAGADRITRIVANLKAYASIDCASTAPADLNDAVRAAVGVIGDHTPPNIRIETDLQPLFPFSCDLSRMNQVLFALLQNGCQALGGGGGVIRVTSCLSGNEIRIAVHDNGCGIAADVVNRIFDPFFTTRDVGKGMGLGLTVSNDIVGAHGGRIEVESTVGAGSTFSVHLPLGPAPDGQGKSL